MKFSFAYIDGVKHVKMISATSTYGMGLWTSFVWGLCNIFGTECKCLGKKVDKAKNAAVMQLIEKAQATGATGIMNVQFQQHGTSVFMYGIAYVEE